MATYAKASYNAAKYATNRPTYPPQLFELLFRYHERGANARFDTAVDIGCGPGQATLELTPFKRVIGVDPSETMIQQARSNLETVECQNKVGYTQSPAENMAFLSNGTMDLLLSAQSGHWLDWQEVWREAARVLKPHGTLAAWGYSEFRLSRYPSATPLIHAYSQGSDPTNSLGPYWERPGRTILDEHLVAIPDPATVVPGQFMDFQRLYFSGEHHSSLPNPQAVILKKTMTWDGLLAYLRTSSSLHTFHEKCPEDIQHPDGDIAVRFCNRLKAHVSHNEKGDTLAGTDEIDVEWPMAVILARHI